jgi:hypothetical protein
MDEQAKRELRLRIGRMRRRIDRRVRGVEARGRELLSWRTYVERYPGYAVLAALGAGLACSAGLRRGRLPQRLGWSLARGAAGRAARLVLSEMRRLWDEESA